jgi:ferredoxin-NADP reductase
VRFADSMSIASPPEDNGPIEFYVRRVAMPESKNPLTHRLWRRRRGDRIYMRTVAAGVFAIAGTIGSDDRRMRIMVASGTGLAPFVSMVRSEVRRNPRIDFSDWVLLHGASHAAELGYRRELLAYRRPIAFATGARSVVRRRPPSGLATWGGSNRSSNPLDCRISRGV